MTRHSFIQMSKLYNVKGRISYILQAMQDRKTSMPLTAPQTIPFGETLQKNVSRNLSEATRRGSVSKQGN